MHGRNPGSDLLGRLHYEVFPEIPASWREVHARCLQGATERGDCDEFETPGGPRIYMRWEATPWRNEDGEIAGIVIFAEDITEQVETRARLAERESLIRDLFEQSPIGLNLCRMDGLWLESNPEFLRIIGYTREEADGGLTYWQLTPRKYDADEAKQLEALSTTKRYGPYEKEFIRKDGRLIPVRLNGFIVERDGQQFIWSLIEDLTAQRALEQKLEEERVRAIQSSKLATLGEMAASFAHEINNPLGIISAYAHLLRSALERGEKADVTEAVGVIDGAVERAARIVKGLRKFARESGQDPSEKILLSEVVEDALNLCRARIQNHGVDLSVDVDTEARVEGHSIELSQVFVNLLNNAFDAARNGEQKWIRVMACEEDGEGFVSVAVEDSGPGMTADADDIFRSFFTTKKPGEGTGLGLSISRSIVERHGGTLVYDRSSSPTRFVVRLPRVRA